MKSFVNKLGSTLPVALCDDICGGRLYRELLKGNFIGASDHYVSVTLNTDSIPVFKSSNFEFWPIFILINELPYRMRYILLNPLLLLSVTSNISHVRLLEYSRTIEYLLGYGMA